MNDYWSHFSFTLLSAICRFSFSFSFSFRTVISLLYAKSHSDEKKNQFATLFWHCEYVDFHSNRNESIEWEVSSFRAQANVFFFWIFPPNERGLKLCFFWFHHQYTERRLKLMIWIKKKQTNQNISINLYYNHLIVYKTRNLCELLIKTTDRNQNENKVNGIWKNPIFCFLLNGFWLPKNGTNSLEFNENTRLV